VVDKVLEILGAEAVHEVHNHHNFAWREEHFGRSYWVVRKGCTPARPGQEGFVGGSMGDPSVILEGVESADATESLYSTLHVAAPRAAPVQGAAEGRRPAPPAAGAGRPAPAPATACSRPPRRAAAQTTRPHACARSGSTSRSRPVRSTGRPCRHACAGRASCWS